MARSSHNHSKATQTSNGFMSATDKIKLDGIDTSQYETKENSQSKYDELKSIKPDWNQNDETQLDYIKNRPFYDALETLADEITVNNGDTLDISFKQGETVTVIWDGVESIKIVDSCTVVSGRWEILYNTLGNQSYLNDSENTFEDNGEKYLIKNNTEQSYSTITCDSSSHTISIIRQCVVGIEDKYLPNIWRGVGDNSLSFNNSHNVASGACSHAEGKHTTASGAYSHAEGSYTTASGTCSHAEGSDTTASGICSHAEGIHTTASAYYAHAEGSSTTASGIYSHAEGSGTTASGDFQHVQGKHNIEDTENKYAHIIGNGAVAAKRSNAHTLDWEGNAEFAGDVIANGCGGQTPISLIDIARKVNSLESGVVAPSVPEFNWQISQIDESTGSFTADTANMRIAVSLAKFNSDATIIFPTTNKYQYCVYVYGLDGTLIREESAISGWQTNPIYEIAKDRFVSIKVKETNYAVWTDETIAAYAEAFQITMEDNSLNGLIDRIEELESKQVSLDEFDSRITENENSIEAIKTTLNDLESNTNILLQYNGNFFTNLVNGEISWESGLNVSDGSTTFVRSNDYGFVSADSVFIAHMPSTAKVSYYTYSLVDGEYVWDAVSDWYVGVPTFNVQGGKYYRVLFYDANGISPNDCRVILTNSLTEELLNNSIQNQLLNYTLTATEQVEMNTTKNTIKSLATPNTALVATFADLHIVCSTDDEVLKNNSANIQKSFTQYNKIAEDCKIDMCLWLGDYMNNSAETNKETAVNSLAMLKTYASQMDSSAPIMVLKGNHDDNTMYVDYENGWLSDEELYNAIGNIDEDRVNRHTDFIERGYGYYDIPNKKIRIFGLNTVDINQTLNNNSLDYKGQWTYGFRQEQLDFIIEHLKFDESGWQVMFFGHHPIEAVGITGDGVDSDKGGKAFLEILKAFVNKTFGSYSTTTSNFESEITYDFTNNKSNTVIACVYGHTHKDDLQVYDGINHFSTKAVCGYDSSTTYSSRSTYFVIDRKNRVLTAVANGAGDDYTINY